MQNKITKKSKRTPNYKKITKWLQDKSILNNELLKKAVKEGDLELVDWIGETIDIDNDILEILFDKESNLDSSTQLEILKSLFNNGCDINSGHILFMVECNNLKAVKFAIQNSSIYSEEYYGDEDMKYNVKHVHIIHQFIGANHGIRDMNGNEAYDSYHTCETLKSYLKRNPGASF